MERQEALYITEIMVKELIECSIYPLKSYWMSVMEGLEELKSGVYEEDEPFAVYMSIKDLPIGRYFLDCWGEEIGSTSAAITSIIQDLSSSLESSQRNNPKANLDNRKPI